MERENIIAKVKVLLEELTFIQDSYFKCLCQQLGLTSEGGEWLFDYIYNSDKPSFEEYLEDYGKTFGELK
jgi:hypothetical protein